VSPFIVAPLRSLATPRDKKKIAIVRVAEKAWNRSTRVHLVHLAHSIDQVFNHQLRTAAAVEGKITVLEGVHVEVHGVVAAVSLKNARHRRWGRIGEYRVD